MATGNQNRFDIETRIADESRVDLRKLVAAHEYSPGVVQDTPEVKVTALDDPDPGPQRVGSLELGSSAPRPVASALTLVRGAVERVADSS